MDSKKILSEIDTILQQTAGITAGRGTQYVSDDYGGSYASDSELARAGALLQSAIIRLTRPGSVHSRNAAEMVKNYQLINQYTVDGMRGILEGIRLEYQNGYLQNVGELIAADIFSDFLEMSEYLLSEGYKDPAAVLAGGVLEEHTRKLCVNNGIDTKLPDGKFKKLDMMNADLKKKDVYTLNEQKIITAWAGIRNDAAHGDFNQYDKAQVEGMIRGIREFLMKYPA